ncbi:MAG TPA: DUF2203 domain-containing protein [Acidimicrobiales bacterium]|nr:DUF2203 domain-containing protein [Acidimicrobiales bacterium]
MRYWTEAEARAELPRLRTLIDVIARAAAQRRVAATNGHSVSSNGTGPDHAGGGSENGGDVTGPGEPVDVQSAVAELAEKGIVLRDPQTGLVDFPAITDKGVVYLLCWKRDEDDLGWWHFAEEGFAGRRPLPVPPDL